MYNTYTYGKEHEHNESIPVTLTHVAENRQRDTIIMLDIFMISYNEESLRSSKEIVNYIKH